MNWIIGAIIYIIIGCFFLGVSIIIFDKKYPIEEEKDILASIIVLWPIYLIIFIGTIFADKFFKNK